MTSKQLIDIKLRIQIAELKLQVSCNHKWVKYAGYKCIKCGFISGGNEKVNTQIEKELTHPIT